MTEQKESNIPSEKNSLSQCTKVGMYGMCLEESEDVRGDQHRRDLVGVQTGAVEKGYE